MARLARVVVPEISYHIAHRGNRRARTLLYDTDREAYLARLERTCHAHGLHVGAWCLMSNGSKDFITRLESELESILQPQSSGRKAQASADKDLTDDMYAVV